MTGDERTRLSKFLSYVLRHRPDAVGLELDEAGWVEVDVLIEAARAHGRALTREAVDEVVATSPKRRFALSADGRRIRANQGHSVPVSLGLEPLAPPETLFHGTVAAALEGIRARGLVRMERHHVHLSADRETAARVGGRRGRAIILEVRAQAMHRAGFVFFRSDNGVWLTDRVPLEYLELPTPAA